jgi:hypothetical protein
VPFYIDRAIQQQVKEGLEFAEFAKKAVSAVWSLSATLPEDNAAAGLPEPAKIIGTYVSALKVNQGAITVTFGGKANRFIQGKHVTLRPGYVPDAPSCRFPGSVDLRRRSQGSNSQARTRPTSRLRGSRSLVESEVAG